MADRESSTYVIYKFLASRMSGRLWRNNNGGMKDATGRFVWFGLGTEVRETMASSDLIGIIPVEITAEMVGKTIGVFASVEVKTEETMNTNNERRRKQAKWCNMIKEQHGISGFVASAKDFTRLVNNYKEGLKNG